MRWGDWVNRIAEAKTLKDVKDIRAEIRTAVERKEMTYLDESYLAVVALLAENAIIWRDEAYAMIM